jgi:repressor LexA
MTKRSELVLDFIKAYMKIHGVPPSYEVIAKGLGLKAKSNIHRIVHKLQEEGFVQMKPYKFHSIRLVDKSAKEMASL